ncbi:galactose-3-O-sulfotransferase 2-like [Ylistrum balloti]|uniref:galactose-3-O-sulfotransferase 2-like n=1 Tax=Ylistrum balloti TaxID=509963 RepID=UPI002905E684|nr:galactose-3-O-sulfotransferase 2-like [Ylistrum balloti]
MLIKNNFCTDTKKRLWLLLFIGSCVLVTLYSLWTSNSTADSFFTQKFKTSKELLSYRHRNSSYANTKQHDSFNKSRYISKGWPANHIAFLKIHKAASTTVASLFQRYGKENNLVFAIPRGHGGGGTALTSRFFFPPPKRGTYDITCGHVPYNREEFSRVLPNDTLYIGIVREPFSQFRSFVRFFRPKNILSLSGDNPVLRYLSQNESHMEFQRYTVTRVRSKIHDFNMMANEFGFPESLFQSRDPKQTQIYLRKLDEEMDLVLVVEYLDESLVLMRRLLNWDLKYILYISLHVNKIEDPRLQFGSKEESLYRARSYLDHALYDFFAHKLKEILRRQRVDFYEELAYFKKTRMKFNHFCLYFDSGTLVNTTISFERSEWNQPFVITRKHCQQLSSATFLRRQAKSQGIVMKNR